jgi:hypothetical protein
MTALLLGGLGKYLAIGGAALLAFIAAILKARNSGAALERAKQAAAESSAIQEAKRIDEAVAGNSPDKNREELAKWSKRP